MGQSRSIIKTIGRLGLEYLLLNLFNNDIFFMYNFTQNLIIHDVLSPHC